MSLGIFVLLAITLLVSSLFVFNLFFSLINSTKGYPPSLSSTKKVIKSIEKIYDFKPDQKVADCGSGNGNVLLGLKHLPIKITGYEINPVLVFLSKLRTFPYKNIAVKNKNFLKEDLSNYDVIFIYGMEKLMLELEEKIAKDNLHDKVIISNRFKFQSIKHTKQIGKIYLYQL